LTSACFVSTGLAGVVEAAPWVVVTTLAVGAVVLAGEVLIGAEPVVAGVLAATVAAAAGRGVPLLEVVIRSRISASLFWVAALALSSCSALS
jgi:hypothetical protein